MLREENGITLVALIITIIVLIILAAVTIIAVQNSNLVGRTENAALEYANQQKLENKTFSDIADQVSNLEARIDAITGEE